MNPTDCAIAPDCLSIKDRELAKQRRIVAEIREKQERERYGCERSREWARLIPEHRMVLLILAGLDGDLGALARRAWSEFTPGERVAVQVGLRALTLSMSQCVALNVRAG